MKTAMYGHDVTFSKVTIGLPLFKLQALLLKYVQMLPKLPYTKTNTEEKGFLTLRENYFEMFFKEYMFWKNFDTFQISAPA